MKLTKTDPPRTFMVGKYEDIKLTDTARIQLEPNEQVTFITDDAKEYDVARKDWGFFATPSVNHRMRNFGFETYLARDHLARYFVMLVEKEKVALFRRYIETNGYVIITRLDEWT